MHAVRTKPEDRIKAAVIDRLFTSGKVEGDSVLVSEMTVPNFSRRADIVLANGVLAAFEVKSEADSLERLAGQIEDMQRLFQTVCVVVAARFEEKVIADAPTGVGVWSVLPSGELKERRRAKTYAALSVDASLELLTVADIRRFLSSTGSAPPRRAMRGELEELARGYPAKDLTKVALTAIKRRYRERFAAFVQARCSESTLSALPKLKRPANESPGENLHPRALCEVDEPQVCPTHPLLVQAPSGPVIRRRRPTHRLL